MEECDYYNKLSLAQKYILMVMGNIRELDFYVMDDQYKSKKDLNRAP